MVIIASVSKAAAVRYRYLSSALRLGARGETPNTEMRSSKLLVGSQGPRPGKLHTHTRKLAWICQKNLPDFFRITTGMRRLLQDRQDIGATTGTKISRYQDNKAARQRSRELAWFR